MEIRQTLTSLDHSFERIPIRGRHGGDGIEWLDAGHVASPEESAERCKLVRESVADHSILIVLVALQGMVELLAFDCERDRQNLRHIALEGVARLVTGEAVLVALDAAVADPTYSRLARW